jgi:ABC-type polysaccharide/polyol phosphate export permease
MIALRPTLGLYVLSMRINRTFWVMNVFTGLVLPVIVQAVFSPKLDPDARTRLLVANVILALAMVTFRKAGIVLTVDRVFGYRDLLAATGVTRHAYLGAYALDALTLSLLPLGVFAAGVGLLGVPPPVSWSWLGPYALSAASLFVFGIWFGCKSQSLPPVVLAVNLATMGAMAFCPLAYPPERAPALLRPLVSVLPPSLSAETMSAGWLGEPVSPLQLALLAVWTLGVGVLALRRFPWTDSA